MNRRTALKTALLSGASILVLDNLVLGKTKPQSLSLTSSLKLSLTDLRFSALNTINGSVEITDAMAPGILAVLPGGFPLALVRVSTSSISAVSKRCTHQGCEIGSYNGSKFICPCHGSEFNPDGSRISGPAPGPLPTYSVIINGSIVTISGLPGSGAWNLTAADDPTLATAFSLLPNKPNPFSDRTTISYVIGAAAMVQLTVYDCAGKEVRELVNNRHTPGTYTVSFETGGLSAGAYFYTLRAGRYVESKKMTITR
jgi:nitrite reductase/ring-hydroxylating ferredoxin subunit